MSHDEQLKKIHELWLEVKEIKRRCHNATSEDMQKVSELVTAYNVFIGRVRMKISACQIPNICHTVAKLLKGHGIIDNIYA